MASIRETLGTFLQPISYRLAHLPRTENDEARILCHCTLNHVYNVYKIRYEVYNDLDQLVIRGTHKGETCTVIFEVQPHRIYFTHFYVRENKMCPRGIDRFWGATRKGKIAEFAPVFMDLTNENEPVDQPQDTKVQAKKSPETSHFGFLITDKALRQLRQKQNKQKHQPHPLESLEQRVTRLQQNYALQSVSGPYTAMFQQLEKPLPNMQSVPQLEVMDDHQPEVRGEPQTMETIPNMQSVPEKCCDPPVVDNEAGTRCISKTPQVCPFCPLSPRSPRSPKSFYSEDSSDISTLEDSPLCQRLSDLLKPSLSPLSPLSLLSPLSPLSPLPYDLDESLAPSQKIPLPPSGTSSEGSYEKL